MPGAVLGAFQVLPQVRGPSKWGAVCHLHFPDGKMEALGGYVACPVQLPSKRQ